MQKHEQVYKSMQPYLIVCKLCSSLEKYAKQCRTMKIRQNYVKIIQKLINVRKVPGIHWEYTEKVLGKYWKSIEVLKYWKSNTPATPM